MRSLWLDRGTGPELVGDVAADPARIVEDREQLRDLFHRIARELSPRERRALLHVANGGTYAGDKSIDNALQRARRKLALPPTTRQVAA